MKNNKILIVDDESDIIDTISFRLQQEGYECISASDGIEALKKARTENPGLIILDVMLPKMNGYKVSRLLKFDEKYQQIPIIMLTAKTQDSERITGIETGADGYITKPFDMNNLIAMIQKHMQ